jgi:ribonuclease P protein component
VLHCRAVPGRVGPRVGMVVARSVGGAVVRNKVRRRLCGVVVDERMFLPDGTDLVVRALPAAAQATYGQLSSDFGRALRALPARMHGQASGRTA